MIKGWRKLIEFDTIIMPILRYAWSRINYSIHEYSAFYWHSSAERYNWRALVNVYRKYMKNILRLSENLKGYFSLMTILFGRTDKQTVHVYRILFIAVFWAGWTEKLCDA